jgi:hypothetical protein
VTALPGMPTKAVNPAPNRDDERQPVGTF